MSEHWQLVQHFVRTCLWHWPAVQSFILTCFWHWPHPYLFLALTSSLPVSDIDLILTCFVLTLHGGVGTLSASAGLHPPQAHIHLQHGPCRLVRHPVDGGPARDVQRHPDQQAHEGHLGPPAGRPAHCVCCQGQKKGYVTAWQWWCMACYGMAMMMCRLLWRDNDDVWLVTACQWWCTACDGETMWRMRCSVTMMTNGTLWRDNDDVWHVMAWQCRCMRCSVTVMTNGTLWRDNDDVWDVAWQ